MKNTVYGYARKSTMRQKIDRQIDNIKARYPDAVIISESYTGTKIDRPAFSKLLAAVKPGDTLVFDEVSRMSRNAAEGFQLYRELYEKGVNLVFLHEPHINTDIYKSALDRHIDISVETGRKSIDKYLDGQSALLNALLLDLAEEQIRIAFDGAQGEVDFLHRRTSEGVRTRQKKYDMETALGLPHEKERGGRKAGTKGGKDFKETKKATAAKEQIRKHSRDFGGSLSDAEVMKLIGIARNSYYKYKRELKEV